MNTPAWKRPETVDGIPVVWGIDGAAKVARKPVQIINDEMDKGLPFLYIDGEFVFVRASLERLAA